MRIAVLSDVHANEAALVRVLADVDALGVDETWCLGDIVGMGARPRECVRLVRDRCDLVIAGNHDAWCTSPTVRLSGPIGAPLTLARLLLDDDDFRWLSDLRPYAHRHGVRVHHGTMKNPYMGFMGRLDAAQQLVAEDCPPVTLCGHTHQPVAFRRKDVEGKAPVKPARVDHDVEVRLDGMRCVLNPGAVGRPQADSDPRAAWMLLDLEAQRARWRLLAYPVEYAVAAMYDAGLGGREADALYGSWRHGRRPLP